MRVVAIKINSKTLIDGQANIKSYENVRDEYSLLNFPNAPVFRRKIKIFQNTYIIS